MAVDSEFVRGFCLEIGFRGEKKDAIGERKAGPSFYALSCSVSGIVCSQFLRSRAGLLFGQGRRTGGRATVCCDTDLQGVDSDRGGVAWVWYRLFSPAIETLKRKTDC